MHDLLSSVKNSSNQQVVEGQAARCDDAVRGRASVGSEGDRLGVLRSLRAWPLARRSGERCSRYRIPCR
jgi:hypothetical protein